MLKSVFRTIVAAAALALSWAPVFAADHREAPTADAYGELDITDLYLYPDPVISGNLVAVLGVNSVADPLFATSYHFQPNGLYRFYFSTTSDGQPSAVIDFTFSQFANGPSCPAPAPLCQTYKAKFPNGVTVSGLVTEGTNADTHLTPVVKTAEGSILIFAGPREDPFFFDGVGFLRSVAAGKNLFTGVDSFKGKNIDAIVVSFPSTYVFPTGTCVGAIGSSKQTPCSAWIATYLGNFKEDQVVSFDDHPELFRPIDREGNPALSTALIPAPLKDAFNFGNPIDDAKNFASVILAQLLAVDKKFGTCPQSATSAAQCNPNTSLLAAVAVPDTLKFAYDQPFAYPNGRQLADRVTDLLISLIVQLPNFTDATAAKTYCPNFPFLGPPIQLASTGTKPFGFNPQSCDAQPTQTVNQNDFDSSYYLATYADIAAAKVDPYQHYLDFGAKEGRNPNAFFDTNFYLSNNPDVAAAGVNPLIHYHQFGWKEGRNPSPQFNTNNYLANNPDVAAAHTDPLYHFLVFGMYEGRAP